MLVPVAVPQGLDAAVSFTRTALLKEWCAETVSAVVHVASFVNKSFSVTFQGHRKLWHLVLSMRPCARVQTTGRISQSHILTCRIHPNIRANTCKVRSLISGEAPWLLGAFGPPSAFSPCPQHTDQEAPWSRPCWAQDGAKAGGHLSLLRLDGAGLWIHYFKISFDFQRERSLEHDTIFWPNA